jgi:hypothetical protein
VRVQNFRGFEDLTVSGLTRVNLIVGENNIGKTALLEAILALTSRAQVMQSYRLQRHRGLASDRRSIPALFGWLFPRQNTSLQIAISGEDETGAKPRTTIGIEGPAGRRISVLSDTDESGGPSASRYEWLVQEYWTDDGAEPSVGRINVTSGPPVTRSMEPVLESDQPIVDADWVFLPVDEPPDARKDAERFSKLVKMRRKSEFVDTLRRVLEPRLCDVALLDTGTQSELYVDVDGIGLAPMGILGTGTARLSSMLLAMADASGGTFFIDEVDTGLHYSVLGEVWRALGKAAAPDAFHCQLFATTHSYECMVAAYEAFADHPEDFSMHRLERRADGGIVSKDFGHETLGLALEHRMEVR